MKKLLCVMIITILIFGAASAAYAANTKTAVNVNFKDLKTTNWAYESVNAMSQKGIVKGYPDGSFKPQGTLTYGEFIKMALIAATKEDVGNSKTGNWALNYYNKALELGCFSHNDIKANQLNRAITRTDMALIMSNIIGEVKLENYDMLEGNLSDITSNTTNSYDIIKVYGLGIITGYQDSTFKPENTLTRAESATVIYRLEDESKRVLPEEKKEDTVTEDKPSGTDIASVIKNYKTYEQEKIDLGGKSLLAEATSYEYVTDMSEYKIEQRVKNGTKGLRINEKHPLELGWGNLYFMKNNEIVEFTRDGIHDSDITSIEYFVFPRYKGVDHVIGIMPNPLYKNK